jgi:uncharacterized membrane protein YeaQ/YmgE (transglycosylase-associated protein family)
MSLIVYLILGAFIGWLAAKLAGRSEGIIASIVIGIVGSFIGGLVSRLFTGGDQAYLAFSWGGLSWSFVGALILVVILNTAQHRRHHSGV